MKEEILSRFQCPRCKYPTLRLSTNVTTEVALVPEHGYLVCDACRTLYPIASSILDMTTAQTLSLTLAGKSNAIPPAPQLYEPLWRRRALTLLTGENFPVEREYKLLNDWTRVRAGQAVVDLGTSTGLYARGLAAACAANAVDAGSRCPDSTGDTIIFGVDTAWGMLAQAKKYVARENAPGIVLVRAAAENLPFHDETMDAVVVGGSLNEMKSIRTALEQARRIVKPGGCMFVMSLGSAARFPGNLLQKLVGISGIQFPSVNDFNVLAENAGWTIANQELKGIVLFTLLTK